MLRWGILASTFVLWLSCMVVVYVNYKPRDNSHLGASARAGLDAIFSEDADPRQVWRIYVDPRRINKTPGANISVWNGLDETKFTEVGMLDSRLKKRGNDDTRREQTTLAQINIPPEFNVPGGQVLNSISYRNRSDISMDHGLEVFDSTIKMGMGFTIASHGVRDGEKLLVTTQILHEGKKQLENREEIPLGDKDLPMHDLMPFQRNRDVRRGFSWNIPMLDTSAIDITGATKPQIVNIKATCFAKREIMYEGRSTTVFEVRTEDGKARAWYSADGVVLKQSFMLADSLELIVIRIDPRNFDSLPGNRWQETAPR